MIAEHCCDIHYILHLLDDFFCFDNCLAEGSRTMIVLKQMLKDLCIPLAAHKTVWDPQLSEYLGITLILIRWKGDYQQKRSIESYK